MPDAVFFAAAVPAALPPVQGPPAGGAVEYEEYYLLTEDGAFWLFTEEGAYVETEYEEGPPEGPEYEYEYIGGGLIDEDILVEFLLPQETPVNPPVRISNRGPVIHRIGNASFQYEPRLLTPIQYSARISSEQYGEPLRGLPNAGNIDFMLDPSIWPILDYHWQGGFFIVSRGLNNNILKGRVDNLTTQTGNNPRVSVNTTSAALDLDKPLPRDLYPDTFGIVELRGRPRPWMRGTCISVEPVYEGLVAPPGFPATARAMYRVSWGANLSSISQVRVGGVIWTPVPTYPPGPSQWFGDLPGGVFYLGGSTDGGEVRCDASTTNALSWTSAALFDEVVKLAGGVCDTDSLAQFQADAVWSVGYWIRPEQVNCLAILDEIVAGIGGWWAYDHMEAVRVGVVKAPPAPTLKLSEIEIEECRLVQLIPPAWRIRIEYRRNWVPATGFFTGVTAAAQQAQSAPGLVAPAFEQVSIKNTERRAVDVPIIRSLLLQESHANQVRDRLELAWSVRRRLYEVQCQIEAMPELYTGASIDFEMVNLAAGWIHSAVWTIGGGPSVLQVWG